MVPFDVDTANEQTVDNAADDAAAENVDDKVVEEETDDKKEEKPKMKDLSPLFVGVVLVNGEPLLPLIL